MNFREVMEEAYATAKEKGFHDVGRNHGDVCTLINTEISEFFEAYRKKEGLDREAEECADIMIRLADYAKECHISFVDESVKLNRLNVRSGLAARKFDELMQESLGTFLQYMSREVARMFDAADKPGGRHIYSNYIWRLVLMCLFLADSGGFDLENAIRIKMTINKNRPAMHGGKIL